MPIRIGSRRVRMRPSLRRVQNVVGRPPRWIRHPERTVSSRNTAFSPCCHAAHAGNPAGTPVGCGAAPE